MQDRDLVAAIVAGDPAGLAAAYDRYASALYAYCRTMLRDPEDAADALQDTFVVAAQKLDGLRDADRLRPWLYAVARNECLRRVRGRQATVELDQAGEVSDDGVDVEAGLREADVRGLIWAAIQGLNPGEREVFELNVRHELEGADLAAALGVSQNHAHALLSRARGQLEKSLGALLVARTGREDCPELAALLTGWDGELTALLRKRINRHVEQCEVCGERKRRELRPEALLGALPVLLLPAGLRSRVLHLVGDALPQYGAAGSSGNGATSGGSSGEASSSGAPSAAAPSAGAASGFADAAAYCAHVAKRAQPFDRAGFPVSLERRFRPLAAARRRSLIAALLLLLLLLGLGGYTALRFIAPDSTAATLPAQSPSPVVLVAGSPSPTLIEISVGAASASPSKSPSASPSPSAARSTQIIVVPSPPRSPSPSRSPSRSPSPSPPPPPGFLVMADPKSTPYVVWATQAGNGYQGTFTVVAQDGTVSGFTVTVPAPSQSWGYPLVDTPSHGPLASGADVIVTVTLQTYPRNQPVVLVVQPPAPQAPIQVTVSPSIPVIP